MSEAQDVRALLPGVELGEPVELGGSERSQVSRVAARWPGHSATSLVVKRFGAAGEGWARETAALSVLGEQAPVARLIASAPPVVVQSDLGAGPSVADALLGADAGAASAAVAGWAEALGLLHRATLAARDDFRSALSERAGELPIDPAPWAATLADTAQLLERQCDRVGTPFTAAARHELADLARRLGPDGAAAITPDDACPDNNVRAGNRLWLLDFEGAQWRHVAWDVAYLVVPWPSCWCSWRMPSEVSDAALERYRATVEDALPYVRTTDFRRDVARAAVGWAFVSSAWFLPRALADDPPFGDPAQRTPTRRAMTLHRLDLARRNPDLPALADLAAALRGRLVEIWGDVPLGYAPAFELR